MRRCTALQESTSGPSTRTTASTRERSTKTKLASHAQRIPIQLVAPSTHARHVQLDCTATAAHPSVLAAPPRAELSWDCYCGLSPFLPSPGW